MRLVAASLVLTLLGMGAVFAQTAPRSTTATGTTKPPGASERPTTAGAPFTKANTEEQMVKAQRASAARDKAWDSKMRTTMGSICKGC